MAWEGALISDFRYDISYRCSVLTSCVIYGSHNGKGTWPRRQTVGAVGLIDHPCRVGARVSGVAFIEYCNNWRRDTPRSAAMARTIDRV